MGFEDFTDAIGFGTILQQNISTTHRFQSNSCSHGYTRLLESCYVSVYQQNTMFNII